MRDMKPAISEAAARLLAKIRFGDGGGKNFIDGILREG